MIRFHFFRWPGDRLPGKPGKKGMVQCCHVYGTGPLEELLSWARVNRISQKWLQQNGRQIPHFDIWGTNLKRCGAGVTNQQFAADLRRWREGSLCRGNG